MSLLGIVFVPSNILHELFFKKLMNWIINFFTSSIGKKIIMSLTGLFLISFLTIHLIGNLQLLKSDGGYAFNTYAYFMTNNPLIKTVSYGLYFFILLHAVQGILLAIKNKKSKGAKYMVNTYKNKTWASNNMALLGILILAFLCIHMGDFWLKMKLGRLDTISTYEGYESIAIKDLYGRVSVAYKQLWIVIVYLLGLLALGFHLLHGFASAFQSLGLNHKKYTPLIKIAGLAYSIIVPLGFAIIPIYMFFK